MLSRWLGLDRAFRVGERVYWGDCDPNKGKYIAAGRVAAIVQPVKWVKQDFPKGQVASILDAMPRSAFSKKARWPVVEVDAHPFTGSPVHITVNPDLLRAFAADLN